MKFLAMHIIEFDINTVQNIVMNMIWISNDF